MPRGLNRRVVVGSLALIVAVVVIVVGLAPLQSQDGEGPQVAQPRMADVEPRIQAWVDATFAQEPTERLAVPFPAARPTPIPGHDAVALIRLPEPTPPEEATDDNDTAEDTPTWPFVRTVSDAERFRLMDSQEIARLEATLAVWSPDATLGLLLPGEAWIELLPLGLSDGPYRVLDDGRLLAVSTVRLDETAEGETPDEPQATLWLIDPRERLTDADAAVTYTPLFTGRQGLALCLVSQSRGQAIVADPEGTGFGRRILSVSLRPGDEPTHLTDGLWAECFTEDESAVVIARPAPDEAGDDEDDMFNRRRNTFLPPGMPEEEAAYLRPMEHVQLDLRQRVESLVLRGESLYRAILFWQGNLYYEEMLNLDRRPDRSMSPIVSWHYLWSLNPEEQTRVPLTGSDRRDDRILGVLPDLGIVYLHSTAFNRYVRLLTADFHHLDLACVSPFSEDFCFTAEGLTWLETQESTGDEWIRAWEDHARVMALTWPEP